MEEMLRAEESRRAESNLALVCVPAEDGSVSFLDTTGAPVSADRLRTVDTTRIREAVENACNRINSDIESLGSIHLGTPNPEIKPRYVCVPFAEREPAAPAATTLTLTDRLLGRGGRIEAENKHARLLYEQALADWNGRKNEHDADQRRLANLIEVEIYRDEQAMMQVFELRLAAILWPRETLVSYEVCEDRRTVCLDVDLPEVEHMPTRTAHVPSRSLHLSFKPLSPTRVRKLYVNHIHGVIVRLIGEAFACLPTVQIVIASGYSQRVQPHDGRSREEYLVSLRVDRKDWLRLDFGHLTAIDPAIALGQFELRRNMTKSGKFAAVEPIQCTSAPGQ